MSATIAMTEKAMARFKWHDDKGCSEKHPVRFQPDIGGSETAGDCRIVLDGWSWPCKVWKVLCPGTHMSLGLPLLFNHLITEYGCALFRWTVRSTYFIGSGGAWDRGIRCQAPSFSIPKKKTSSLGLMTLMVSGGQKYSVSRQKFPEEKTLSAQVLYSNLAHLKRLVWNV